MAVVELLRLTRAGLLPTLPLFQRIRTPVQVWTQKGSMSMVSADPRVQPPASSGRLLHHTQELADRASDDCLLSLSASISSSDFLAISEPPIFVSLPCPPREDVSGWWLAPGAGPPGHHHPVIGFQRPSKAPLGELMVCGDNEVVVFVAPRVRPGKDTTEGLDACTRDSSGSVTRGTGNAAVVACLR